MNCKTFIIALLAFVTGTAAALADESVTNITGAKNVTITEINHKLVASVETENETMVFVQPIHLYFSTSSIITGEGLSLFRSPKNRKSSTSWGLTSGGLGFGFCNALNSPGNAGIEMGKSFELSWLNIMGIEATNVYGNKFSLGIGINWRNYRTTLGNCFSIDHGHVTVAPYPDGAEPRLSRIKIFSLQFPLLYRQQFPFGLSKNKMSLTFGPIFNFNTHASVLTAWRENGKKYERKANDVNARPFTIDLFASLHALDFCSFYVRYSPYRALTGRYPLNFNQLSAGLLFLM